MLVMDKWAIALGLCMSIYTMETVYEFYEKF